MQSKGEMMLDIATLNAMYYTLRERCKDCDDTIKKEGFIEAVKIVNNYRLYEFNKLKDEFYNVQLPDMY
jgi:hypothetical protein